jgi:ankyrin repeat protein
MNNTFKFCLLATALLTNISSYANDKLTTVEQTAPLEYNNTSTISPLKGEILIEMIHNSAVGGIEQLINEGLNINATIIGDGTPLIIAVRDNNKKVVESLIQWGADINLSAKNDANPLITAAMNNHLALAEMLFLQGANIDAVIDDDETALINASRQGHYQMVKFLVENGADVNLAITANTLQGSELRSPLNGAKTTEIRDYLVLMGAKA